MASIDDILAGFGLQPGVQEVSSDTQLVSLDSSANLSTILASVFGGIGFTLTGVAGYLCWRYRLQIRALLMFRRYVNSRRVNVEVMNLNLRSDLEPGPIGVMRNVESVFTTEESGRILQPASTPPVLTGSERFLEPALD